MTFVLDKVDIFVKVSYLITNLVDGQSCDAASIWIKAYVCFGLVETLASDMGQKHLG